VARGHEVVGLVRRAGATLPPGVATALCPDLSDRQALRGALTGVQTVVHLAGRAHIADAGDKALEEFRRTNVHGTRVLLEESIAAGVASFAFISSVKAVGEETEVPWTEDVVPAPTSPYGISKLEAEQVVRSLSGESRVAAPILRLPLAYGSGLKANMLHMFGWIARGLPAPLGGIRNRRSLVFAGNVAAAIDAVLGAPGARSETFFVSDQEDLSTPELARRIGAALGRSPRMFTIPGAALRLAGRMSGAVRRLTDSLTIDSSKLTRMTGFVPPHTVDQGLRETAGWFRARKQSR
jgi:nucleoside-diphosphate-sugar epimerase